MIKGAPATAEATAIPEASATTEMQNYPASDSDPSGASDVVLLCLITGSDPASLEHCPPLILIFTKPRLSSFPAMFVQQVVRFIECPFPSPSRLHF